MQTISRKMIGINHNTEIDVIDIWMSKNGAWEWFIYKKEPCGRCMAIVYSPTTPNGEFGSVMIQELKEISAIQLKLSESLPASNFKWKE